MEEREDISEKSTFESPLFNPYFEGFADKDSMQSFFDFLYAHKEVKLHGMLFMNLSKIYIYCVQKKIPGRVIPKECKSWYSLPPC